MAGLFDRLQNEIESREQQEGISPVDLLDLPPTVVTIIKKIIRRNGMKLTEIATALKQSLEETQKALDELVEKGYIRQIEVKKEIWYKAFFRRKADKTLSHSFWSILDDMTEEEEE